MGDRPTVSCDQAVFTSVRGPTGEGYRIIAATPSVRADERAEITRRSPSHGGLCGDDAGAVGLLSYVLSSGRRCVAYCAHAGCEHTGRGGQRVYTHVVLLDQAAYVRFDGDPVRVHALLAEIVGRQGPLLKPTPRLEPLILAVPGQSGQDSAVVPGRPVLSAEWLWPIAESLLSGQRILLAGVDEALPLAEWAMLCVPRSLRERIDVSVGLRFSPTRAMQLTFVGHDDDHLERRVAGQDIRLLRAGEQPPAPGGAFAAWLRLLRRWWRRGRFGDIVQMTRTDRFARYHLKLT